ncbi:multidrug effflux MFS transporter [Marinomonas spartinae]|uniref:multidrug effflux MFS transporter n=1 Tax=Marinomonas spartinae TaxID=1792290 RepID=UPI0018F13E98|nr:multidrug effflux MFS transporter [Marinomonas spartinae]MBJ7556805.1 multidrug effflux MFS transporter [Marinomonas spartinae]
MLACLGPLSISFYTPAMPIIAKELQVSSSMIGLSLTIFLMTFGFSQLISGSISDYKGRRPVILISLILYFIGSMFCIVSSNIDLLMVGRFLQGVGAAGCVVLARALIFDLYAGQEAAKLINLTSLILIVAPAMAPFFGGLLLESASWRSVFIVLCLLSLCSFLVVYVFLQETLAPEMKHKSNEKSVSVYISIIKRRGFLFPILSIGLITASVYTLSTALPFIIIDRFHVSPVNYGLMMMSQAGSFGISTFLTRKLLTKWNGVVIARIGYVVVSIGAVIYFIQFGLIDVSPALLIVGLSFLAFGNAMVNPGMIAQGFSYTPDARGAASALLGTFQIGGGFIGSLSVTSLFDDYTHAVTTVIPMLIFLSFLLFRLSNKQTTLECNRSEERKGFK